MAFDPVLLDSPIDWRHPDLAGFLDNLQGNILKSHGRNNTLNSFFSFDPKRAASIRQAIAAITPSILTAAQQLRSSHTFRLAVQNPLHDVPDGGPVAFFFLTATGYDALDLNAPDDPAFRAGMPASGQELSDPPIIDWFEHWAKPNLHAMLLVGDDDPNRLAATSTPLEQALMAAGAVLLGRDAGEVLRVDKSARDPKGAGIEHFGYVDGVSQPLMLADEIAREQPIDLFKLGPATAAVVPDPLGGRPDAYGSYLVYRRLEQNVRGFKAREGGNSPDDTPDTLATALDFRGKPVRERAGAMVVGRFENGAPVTLHALDADPATGIEFPASNRFDYSADPVGNNCPFHAHIRKTNPRQPGDEIRLMPRRGIPFGERSEESMEDLEQMPTGGVGLLFMAYNVDIARQFEFVQATWANNPSFPDGTSGLDPVIGQELPPIDTNGPRMAQKWPLERGAPAHPEDHVKQADFSFGGFVTMTGGAYFFAPSISFLRSLG